MNTNNITLEVGFGNGDSLLEMAIKQPNQNFLGIEVYEAGVGRLINEASKNNLNNLKIIKEDAVEVLNNNITDSSISNFQLFFELLCDICHITKKSAKNLILALFI